MPSDLNERFLRRFVRPFGLDVAATALAVDAIEELGRQGSLSPGRGPAAGPLVRLGLRPLAARAAAERRRQKQSRSRLEPSAELKAAVRRLAEAGPETAIAAERWRGSETRELLYWIPFLRWAVLTMPELRGRLAVAARPEAVHWYEDLDARVVALEEGEDVLTVLAAPEVVHLEPGLVERHVQTLAAPTRSPASMIAASSSPPSRHPTRREVRVRRRGVSSARGRAPVARRAWSARPGPR